MPEIGKINIDFQIVESHDPKILMIADFSEWAHIVNEPCVVSITMPGAANPIQYNFVKHNINGFNSNTLGITCSTGCDDPDYLDLPDNTGSDMDEWVTAIHQLQRIIATNQIRREYPELFNKKKRQIPYIKPEDRNQVKI